MPAELDASRKSASAQALGGVLAALILIGSGCRPEPAPRPPVASAPVDSPSVESASAANPAVEGASVESASVANPAVEGATVAGAGVAQPTATSPRYLARLEFPTSDDGRAKPVRVLAGDLDGDGRDEIVAATRSPGGIEIWSGISPVIAPAPEPRAFAFGDFPVGPVWVEPSASKATKAGIGTARSLAAIASRETLELAVVDLAAALRSKPGDALPVIAHARLPARPRAIASGDLGRDGRADVGVVTIEDELLVYEAPALGGEPRRLSLPREHAVALLFASDGQRIAVGFQGTRKLALLRIDGSVEKAVSLPGIPRELLEADLDGDGDTELAVAAGDESLLVFGLARTGGPPSWLDAAPLEVRVGTVPIALATADSPSVARPPAPGAPSIPAELAVLDLHAQDVRLLGFAHGTAAPLELRAAGQRPTDLAIGDFDGDGAPDIAIANGDARRVGILFGAGGRPRAAGGSPAGKCFASETRVACDRSPVSIAAGDVDGDGRVDVAVLAAADETLCVLSNEGGALVRRSPSIPAPSASSVACADLDGDGRAEIACLVRGAERTSIGVVRSGESTLETLAEIPGRSEVDDLVFTPPSKLPGAGASAIVALPEANQIGIGSVSRAPSGPGFRIDELRFFPGGDGPRAVAWLRSEGKRGRIAVADGGRGPGSPRGVTILDVKADTAGALELDHPLALEMRQVPIAIAAADLDGDGREDLAVLATESGGDSQGWVVPWLAGADGTWRALDPMPTGGRPHRIAACDLDGDGKAEILVTAQGSHHVEVWLARGSPVRFVRAPDLGVGTGPLDILTVDLDGDGQAEIVVANGFSDDVSVVRVR